MKKEEIIKFIFCFISTIILTYFLTGVLVLGFNHEIKNIKKYYTLKFSLEAVTNNYPKAYKSLGISFMLSMAFSSLVFLISKKQKLYGDAKFATRSDIAKMGLFSKKGVIIGKFEEQLLRFDSQEFISLGAPTRTGKGIAVVMPNALDWDESCVVQDIKQECFAYTSKYRRDILGQEVYLFNPFSPKTHCYNPMDYINFNSPNSDNEIRGLANILYPKSGKDKSSDFFIGEANSLFVGLCYMCNDLLNNPLALAFLHRNNLFCEMSLYGILKLSDGFNFSIVNEAEGTQEEISGFFETFEFFKDMEFMSEKTIENLNSLIGYKNAQETLEGILGSFREPLSIFKSDSVRVATSKSDFDLRDLRKKKMTIYIGIKPNMLDVATGILNIFWKQLFSENTKEESKDNKDLKYQVLLLVDEFTSVGYMPLYLKSLAFIASFNLKSMIIYQSYSQLATPIPEGYGSEGAKTLLANHACNIYYAPKELEDSKRLSEMLGNQTIKNRSKNLKGGGGSESDVARALMLPQEVRELPFEEEIILFAGKKPIKCNKAIYYSDPYFINKFKLVSKTLQKTKGSLDKKIIEKAIQNKETLIEVKSYYFDEYMQNYEKKIIAKLEKFENEEN